MQIESEIEIDLEIVFSIIPTTTSVTKTYRQILISQREYLFKMNQDHPEIEEKTIRQFIHSIDLEEERLKSEA